MFNTYFNHNQFRRYLIAFGSFFNDIQIRREDDTGAEIQRLVVPLEYGPKERWLIRLEQDPDFLQGVAVIAPRMTYEMKSIAFDSTRHLNTLNSLKFTSAEAKHMARMYVGVPYNLGFELSILVKTQQDGMQIVEQILPYFTPDLTFKLETLSDLALVEQVPLSLVSVNETDNYEGDFQRRRAIVWTLGFTMHVNFYGPVKSQGRIEEVIIDLFNSPLNDLLDPPTLIAQEILEA